MTGLAGLKVNDTNVPIVFDSTGALFYESPAGSGTLKPIVSAQVTPAPNASMQVAAAFKKGFLAFTDLVNASGPSAVYNLETGVLDPLSMLPVGSAWEANRQYYVGEIITSKTPFGGNSHLYRCTVAGVSGAAEPAFPITEGGVIVDGGVTWTENTPVMAQGIQVPNQPTVTRNAGAGAFAVGRDVYLCISFVNGNGETTVSTSFKYVNTVLNDQFVVQGPLATDLPAWAQALPAPYAVIGYNVYEADVVTGAAAPVSTAYKKVNPVTVALGNNTVVNNVGTGAAPQVFNGATIVPVGNICAGLRYAAVVFINRNGYVSGMTSAAVFSYLGPSAGYSIYVPHIPTGPANTRARLVLFTPAGNLSQTAGFGISSAGPFFWIPPAGFTQANFDWNAIPGGVTVADKVDGIQMTSTVINDNVTTSGTFNFTDDYLKLQQNDLSILFRKIQVPNASDVYYSKTYRRMFYSVDSLPSGWYVSLKDDPESVLGDTGLVQVAQNNGEKRIAVRELNGFLYLLKEKSGHLLTVDATEPQNWNADEKWTGSGPCGPRAVDVCTKFMCYVHQSGVWIFFGGDSPRLISVEIPITWANINWSAKQKIWVMIDDTTREIRVGVPYGKSTVPNLVLKCNYEESPEFAPPVHFSPIAGKEIAAGSCYKWSIDDIPANLAVRINRQLAAPSAAIDPSACQSQILYASSNPDGAVCAEIPFMFSDNGVGIDSFIETACTSDKLRMSKLGGVQANIDGQGLIDVTVITGRAKHPHDGGEPIPKGTIVTKTGAIIPLKKQCEASVTYACGGQGQAEQFRVRLSNNKQPNVWFDAKYISIFHSPVATARPR